MTDRGFFGKRINMLQVLRGIAIIFVMIEHVPYWGFGAFGVDIFFVISGFVTMYSTADEASAGGFKFILRRFLRIAPLYYIMTILTFLGLLVFPDMFRLTTADPVYLVKSLLFIPFDIAGQTMPIVRVGWCLNYEMVFYLIFFIAMKISHRYRGLITSAVIVVMAAVGQIVNFENSALRFWFGENPLEFVFGVTAFYICLKLYPFFCSFREKKGKTALIVVFSAVCIALMVLMSRHMNYLGVPRLARVLNWGIPSFVIFLMGYWTDCMVSVSGLPMFIGNISYSLFLSHYYPVVFMGRLGERTENPLIRTLLALAGFVIAFAISTGVYYFIEKRLNHLLKKI